MKINTNILQLKPSATLLINETVQKLRAKGEKIYHFGFGQSPFSIPKPIVKQLKKNADCNHYLSTTGLPTLKIAIAKFLKENQNIATSSKNVFIGPGSKELLFQSILIFEGTYLIPKGSWVSYLPQINAAGKNAVVLETFFQDNFKLQATTLENYVKENNKSENNILIINSPNNPSGAVYSSEELKKIASVCKKYNITVFSDEIYSQLSFQKKHAPSIFNYYSENTIVFGGLSKVFAAGGYRLGFVVIPEKLEKLKTIYQSLFSETFSAVTAPVQYAAIKAYNYNKEVKTQVALSLAILKIIGNFVYKKLSKAGVHCTKPQGGFYILIGFNTFKATLLNQNITTSKELANYILKTHKVALLPGTDFYFNEDELVFRLAFVDFNGKKALKKYRNYNGEINDTFVKSIAPNVEKGVGKIVEFVNSLK